MDNDNTNINKQYPLHGGVRQLEKEKKENKGELKKRILNKEEIKQEVLRTKGVANLLSETFSEGAHGKTNLGTYKTDLVDRHVGKTNKKEKKLKKFKKLNKSPTEALATGVTNLSTSLSLGDSNQGEVAPQAPEPPQVARAALELRVLTL